MQIEYKRLMADLHYCAQTKVFYGEILDTEACITFQASTRKEAIEAMQWVVDELLAPIV